MKKPNNTAPPVPQFKAKNLDDNRYKDKNKTLAARIDYEWSIYIHEKANVEQKTRALEFLMYAFDISDEDFQQINKKLLALMAERMLHRETNPNYIPGKKPKHLDLNPAELNIKKTKESYRTFDQKQRQLFLAGELLDVNHLYKKGDFFTKPTFLKAEERSRYHVVIHNKLFKLNEKNFDTSKYITHGRRGFAAFTLNANGELSIFNHLSGCLNKENQNLVHSSMNAGAPVIAAGEIRIINGKLRAINTYSGHYQPTLFTVYRLLKHFSDNQVDLNDTMIVTANNLSMHLEGVNTQRIKLPPNAKDPRRYATPANDFLKAIKMTLNQAVNDIQTHLNAYTKEFNFFISLSDYLIGSALTSERGKLAKEFFVFLKDFQENLIKTRTPEALDNQITLLENTILSLEEKNNRLSEQHGKDKDSGRLAKGIGQFKEILQNLRAENPHQEVVSRLKNIH